MGTTDRKVDRAERRGRQMVSDLGRDLREARVAAGLSQATVGRAAGLSRSRVSRIERGHVLRVPLLTLARVLGVVGLELSARAFAAGQPIRDRAHLDLLERLRSRLGPGVGWQVEVPLPIPGDQRTWDALIACTARRIGVEAEMRPTDLQALTRRVALKRRDGGVDCVVLLLADTRWNRAVIREHRESLRSSFPVDGRSALAALAAGRAPDGDALVLL
jgi:transcriptional regulator with XRE-family HTH domain